MKYFAATCAAGVFLAALGTSPVCADQPTKPIRHLVYNFTYGTTSDLEVHSSGIGGVSTGVAMSSQASGSGVTDYSAGSSDHGTITVDVMHEDSNNGLVVSISEEGTSGARSAAPATCVVYGSTVTICDTSHKVNEEEIAVLRLLGSNFIDPSRIDSKQHWSAQSSSPGLDEQSDFMITKSDAGKLTISEERTGKQQGTQIGSMTASSTIGYDFNKQVLMTLSEYEIQRAQHGMGQYQTQKTEITATLASDSMAP